MVHGDLGTHRPRSLSDFRQTATQPLGASPIILEEANFRFRLLSPRAARCLQSDARMELDLRDDIYQRIFSQVASSHAVNS